MTQKLFLHVLMIILYKVYFELKFISTVNILDCFSSIRKLSTATDRFIHEDRTKHLPLSRSGHDCHQKLLDWRPSAKPLYPQHAFVKEVLSPTSSLRRVHRGQNVVGNFTTYSASSWNEIYHQLIKVQEYIQSKKIIKPYRLSKNCINLCRLNICIHKFCTILCVNLTRSLGGGVIVA